MILVIVIVIVIVIILASSNVRAVTLPTAHRVREFTVKPASHFTFYFTVKFM